MRGWSRQGLVLLASLLVLASCAALLMGMVGVSQVELQGAGILVEEELVDALTASALAWAKEELRKDDPDYDYLAESWAQPVDLIALGYFDKLEEILGYPVEVHCRIVDESAKLNINLASTYSLTELGLEDRLGVIQDWTDEDDDVSPGGAESDFYERMDPSYHAKDKPFQLVEELVFLRDYTAATVEGEDVNGNGSLDPNEEDGDDSYPPDNVDDVLDRGARDLLTALGDGRINLNTASVQVLEALLGMTEASAEAIDAWRRGPDSVRGTIDDGILRGPEDLDDLAFLGDFELLMLKASGSYASDHFRVFVRVSLPARKKVFGTTILLRREGLKISEIAKLDMSDSGISEGGDF